MTSPREPARSLLRFLVIALCIVALFAYAWDVQRRRADSSSLVRFGAVPQAASADSRDASLGSRSDGSGTESEFQWPDRSLAWTSLPEFESGAPPSSDAASVAQESSLGVTPKAFTRVVFHVHASDPTSVRKASDLGRELQSLPNTTTEIRRVTFTVSSDNIRIFFDDDRPRAIAVRDALDAADMPIRNFSHYRPLPRPGTIEVWLAADS